MVPHPNYTSSEVDAGTGPLFKTDPEFSQCAFAEGFRLGIARAINQNDRFGHPLRDGMIAIDQLQFGQREFIGRRHGLDGRGLERRFAELTINGHDNPSRFQRGLRTPDVRLAGGPWTCSYRNNYGSVKFASPQKNPKPKFISGRGGNVCAPSGTFVPR